MSIEFYTKGMMYDIFNESGSCPDWSAICQMFPDIGALETVQQDKRHHAEGNVGIHTRMVVKSLMEDRAWRELSYDDRFLLFWTAVFHDVGKLKRTVVEDDGSITSRGHSKTGSSMVRECMRNAGMPFEMREHMCAIIAAHQVPFWLYERVEPEQIKKALKLSLELDPRLLLMHARADARGRVCEDQNALLEGVDLCEVIFADLGVLDHPYAFANAESKVAYFIRDDRHHEYEAFETPVCSVTVMSGLPGSGKDTWIAKNMPDLPVISLDDIREEMKVSADGNQGLVIQTAYENAREFLRKKQDFVWNTTNITFDMRSKIIRLLRDYNAHFRIVYIEALQSDLLKQNASRKAAVPPKAINDLIKKLDPPKDWEAHEVLRIIGGRELSSNAQYHSHDVDLESATM